MLALLIKIMASNLLLPTSQLYSNNHIKPNASINEFQFLKLNLNSIEEQKNENDHENVLSGIFKLSKRYDPANIENKKSDFFSNDESIGKLSRKRLNTSYISMSKNLFQKKSSTKITSKTTAENRSYLFKTQPKLQQHANNQSLSGFHKSVSNSGYKNNKNEDINFTVTKSQKRKLGKRSLHPKFHSKNKQTNVSVFKCYNDRKTNSSVKYNTMKFENDDADYFIYNDIYVETKYRSLNTSNKNNEDSCSMNIIKSDKFQNMFDNWKAVKQNLVKGFALCTCKGFVKYDLFLDQVFHTYMLLEKTRKFITNSKCQYQIRSLNSGRNKLQLSQEETHLMLLRCLSNLKNTIILRYNITPQNKKTFTFERNLIAQKEILKKKLTENKDALSKIYKDLANFIQNFVYAQVNEVAFETMIFYDKSISFEKINNLKHACIAVLKLIDALKDNLYIFNLFDIEQKSVADKDLMTEIDSKFRLKNAQNIHLLIIRLYEILSLFPKNKLHFKFLYDIQAKSIEYICKYHFVALSLENENYDYIIDLYQNIRERHCD